MKNAALFLSLVFACLVLSCAKKETPAPMAAADPKAVWQLITKDDPYKKYQSWPGSEGMRNGKAPHGAFYRVFINDALSSALPLQAPLVPAGGMIVKESYNSSKEMTALYVMAKVPGYNPNAGDWYWANYTPDGKVIMEGKVGMCIDCHGAFKDNDSVMFTRLVK